MYEGAWASQVLGENLETRAPFRSIPAGAGSWRAGPGGVLQGRFGWANPTTGFVLNAPQTSQDLFGVVIPLRSVNGANGGVIGGSARFGGPQARWTWQTFDKQYGAWRIREGLVCTLMDRGNFWLRFSGGANYGDIVYALNDGSGAAVSGSISNSTETTWRVCTPTSAGQLGKVSSHTSFFGGS